MEHKINGDVHQLGWKVFTTQSKNFPNFNSFLVIFTSLSLSINKVLFKKKKKARTTKNYTVFITICHMASCE